MLQRGAAMSVMDLNIEGDVAWLMLNRPRKKNALTHEMWEALPGLLQQVEADPRAKVLLLASSTPEAFCAGADIEEFAAKASDPAWRRRNQAAIRETQVTLARLSKPTIAVIDGVCVGGGCGIAIACDMRVAADTARLGITPAKLGLVYSLHDTKLLVDLVGPSRARWILYTGALFSAAEARDMGLVDVLTSREDLRGTALALAQSIAANSQHSIRSTKKIIQRILDGAADDDAESIAQFFDAFDGPDLQEGVKAFGEKRRPQFSVR